MKRIAVAFRWLFGPDLWNRRGPGRELRRPRRSKVGMKERKSRRAAAGVLCCQCVQPRPLAVRDSLYCIKCGAELPTSGAGEFQR
jgi:hypothetical protein